MTAWQQIALGEVLHLHYGKALDPALRDPDGSVPVYGANGIKNYAAVSLTTGPVLVIGRKGSAGEVTRVDGSLWPLDVTYYTEHDKEKVDFDFLEYLLRVLDLPALAKGVKPGINRNDVYALQVSLPSLVEQKQIVALLDQAFAALDHASLNAEASVADTRSLFDGALREHLNNFANGEAQASLAEMCRTIVDCEHKTAPVSKTGYPSIRTPNIGKGVLDLEGVYRVSDPIYRKWTKRAVPEPGDLIMAREAPAGNVAVIPQGERVCLGQRTLLIKPDSGTTVPHFLAFLLLHPVMQERLLSKSTGATVQHVNMKDIRLLPMPALPPLVMQRQVVEALERIRETANKLVQKANKRLDDIAALRQSLLYAAFSGQLT